MQLTHCEAALQIWLLVPQSALLWQVPWTQAPFRQMTISGDRTTDLAAALAMVRAQNSPYLPAHAAIVRLDTGQTALSIEFAAPSPLGLLTAVLTVQREG